MTRSSFASEGGFQQRKRVRFGTSCDADARCVNAIYPIGNQHSYTLGVERAAANGGYGWKAAVPAHPDLADPTRLPRHDPPRAFYAPERVVRSMPTERANIIEADKRIPSLNYCIMKFEMTASFRSLTTNRERGL